MNNVTIAEQNDIEQLLEVYVKTSRQNHDFLGEDNIQIAKELVRNVYFAMSTSLIIKEDDKVVAFLSFIAQQIAALFVDPDYQGRGYGKQLLDIAINKYNCDTLEVFVKNKQAFNFYVYVGFTKIGDAKEEYEKQMGRVENLIKDLAYDLSIGNNKIIKNLTNYCYNKKKYNVSKF